MATKIDPVIRDMKRAELVKALESVCIQCYDHESDHTLKVALQDCVRTKDLTISDIEFMNEALDKS